MIPVFWSLLGHENALRPLDYGAERAHDLRMLHWLKHHADIYRYGMSLLLVLLGFWVICAVAAVLLLCALEMLIGLELSTGRWVLCTLALYPFALPSIAQAFADNVRRDPPPAPVDLMRRQMGKPPRKAQP
jgi:hypothetical protein